MKRNDIVALHEKTQAELREQLAEVEKQLVQARVDRSAGKLDNTAKVQVLTDDVARIKTVLREQELAAA